YKNAWFCGYTPSLSTAVWAGFPETEVPMTAPATSITVYGGTWPAQIWQRFMSAALDGTAPEPFPPMPAPAPSTRPVPPRPRQSRSRPRRPTAAPSPTRPTQTGDGHRGGPEPSHEARRAGGAHRRI